MGSRAPAVRTAPARHVGRRPRPDARRRGGAGGTDRAAGRRAAGGRRRPDVRRAPRPVLARRRARGRSDRSCSSSTTCTGPTAPRSGSSSSSRTGSTRCRRCCSRPSGPRRTARSAGRRSRPRSSSPRCRSPARPPCSPSATARRSPPRSPRRATPPPAAIRCWSAAWPRDCATARMPVRWRGPDRTPSPARSARRSRAWETGRRGSPAGWRCSTTRRSSLVARLTGIDAREASGFAEQLVRAGILRDVRPLEFEHALVRDAVLGGLTAAERSRLHADAARMLADAGAGPEAVAVHLLHTEPAGRRARGGHARRGRPARPRLGSAERGGGVPRPRPRRAARGRAALGAAARPRTGRERARPARGARPRARGVRCRPRRGRPRAGRARADVGERSRAPGPAGGARDGRAGDRRRRRPAPRARAQAGGGPLHGALHEPRGTAAGARRRRAVRGSGGPHRRGVRAAGACGDPPLPAGAHRRGGRRPDRARGGRS